MARRRRYVERTLPDRFERRYRQEELRTRPSVRDWREARGPTKISVRKKGKRVPLVPRRARPVWHGGLRKAPKRLYPGVKTRRLLPGSTEKKRRVVFTRALLSAPLVTGSRLKALAQPLPHPTAVRLDCVEAIRLAGRNRLQAMRRRLGGGFGSYMRRRRYTDGWRRSNEINRCP